LLDAARQPATVFDLRPSFHVAAPQRTFDVPHMAQRLDVQLGEFAALLGFDLARDRLAPGESIDLTLYWQARAETELSFKVFVHVLDAADRVVAQADAVPLGGLRPTTGWLPGEIIADRYTLVLPGDLPAGHYQLVTGLYDPETGTRVLTSAGRDAIPLANLEVK
jgi:hypothetical protein